MIRFQRFFRGITLLSCALFCTASYAVGLGSVRIVSQNENHLEAKIAILMSDQEMQSHQSIKAQLGDQPTYVKFGLEYPSSQVQSTVTIENNQQGKPQFILFNMQQTTGTFEKAFQDVVLELSWSSGKVTRVYTLLNPNAKEVEVQAGDSILSILSKSEPDLVGPQADQKMLALYRLNPKAFISGNIHRLKQGEILRLPTQAMTASIPEEEARVFAEQSHHDFASARLDQASDSVIAQNNRTYEAANIKKELTDRLKIGSSQMETEQSIQQAQLNEAMIAQKKMLEDAQLRIEELEKNIADLKALQAQKKELRVDSKYRQSQPGIETLVGVLCLIGVFLFGVLRTHSSASLPVPPQAFPTTHLSSDPDRQMLNQQDAARTHPFETPLHIQQLFHSIDLNLPSRDGPELLNPSISAPDLPEASVKNTAGSLSVNDQRLRMNLALSYIKINDFQTAKILLADLSTLPNATPEIVNQAKQLLQEIG